MGSVTPLFSHSFALNFGSLPLRSAINPTSLSIRAEKGEFFHIFWDSMKAFQSESLQYGSVDKNIRCICDVIIESFSYMHAFETVLILPIYYQVGK